MQICGFEGFPKKNKSALFGLVSYNDPCLMTPCFWHSFQMPTGSGFIFCVNRRVSPTLRVTRWRNDTQLKNAPCVYHPILVDESIHHKMQMPTDDTMTIIHCHCIICWHLHNNDTVFACQSRHLSVWWHQQLLRIAWIAAVFIQGKHCAPVLWCAWSVLETIPDHPNKPPIWDAIHSKWNSSQNIHAPWMVRLSFVEVL